MEVVGHAMYLGIMLGPSAGAVQWSASIAKFKGRVADIFESRLPMKLAAVQYSSRAVSVLSFLGQVAPREQLGLCVRRKPMPVRGRLEPPSGVRAAVGAWA